MNISSDLSFNDFIAAIGGQITAEKRVTFPAETPVNNVSQTQVSILGHYALIAFSGADSHKFLQGQTTCNLKDITSEKSTPGACCTPKGRMYCNFQLALDHADQYWMRVRHDVIESSLQTLNKYLALFRGSKSHNCLNTHVVIGVFGEEADTLITKLFGQCPTETNSSFSHDKGIVICVDEVAKRYELWLSADNAIAIWPTLKADCTLADNDVWRLANINTGIGDVHAETNDEFVPQMLNLQALNGISFNKGCYTGQEIVARMHYLGKLKKRMYRAECERLDTEPVSGTELFSVNEISGNIQTVGHIVEAVISNDKTHILVVIPDELVEKNKTVTIGEAGAAITVLSLPYVINHHASKTPM